MLLGEPFDGRRAAEMKLVNRAVPRARLEEETRAIAATLAGKDRHALRLTKELFWHSRGMERDAALAFANAKVRELTLLQEGKWIEQGIGQFLKGGYRPGLAESAGRPGDDDTPDGGACSHEFSAT
jgi:trans-feruloyl-CoA hydratase/vanillin synthase